MGKGALRYTDKASGRPVIDIPKDMLGAHLGRNRSRTQKRAEARWKQGAMGEAGKGDMRRPSSPNSDPDAWLKIYCEFFKTGDETCACIECRNGRR